MSPRGAVITAAMAVICVAFLGLPFSVPVPHVPRLFLPLPATASTDAAAFSASFVVGCLLLRRLWAPLAPEWAEAAAAVQLRTGAEMLVIAASAAITNLVSSGGPLPFSRTVMEAATTAQVVLAVSMAFYVGMLLLLVSFNWSVPAALIAYPTTVFLKLTAAILMLVNLLFILAFMFPA